MEEKNKKPLYPFGFGLSYTSFRIRQIKSWQEEQRLCTSAVIENIGDREGSEVLQMYVSAEKSAVTRPKYSLKDFQKVFLNNSDTLPPRSSMPVPPQSPDFS